MSIGQYKDNTYTRSISKGINLRSYFDGMEEIKKFRITGFYHTHPNGAGIHDSDRLVPSDQDLKVRDHGLKINPHLIFILLMAPNNGDKLPMKIDYTTGFQYRLR